MEMKCRVKLSFFTKRKREEEKSEMVSWIISTKEKKRKVKW